MLIQTVGYICGKIYLHRSLSNSFGACISMQEVHVEIESTPRSNGRAKLECPLFMDTTFGSKLDLVVDIMAICKYNDSCQKKKVATRLHVPCEL